MSAAMPANPAPASRTERDARLRLLETYRELAATQAANVDGPPDTEALRACVAFLRHGVMPFARREELALAPGSALAGDTRFEHDFLAAETEQLADAVAALERAGASARACRTALVHVWRQLHRIDAALELHLVRESEREAAAAETEIQRPARRATQASGGSHGRASLRHMLEAEADAFLADGAWGILATGGPTGPYAVPVSYAFDGTRLYVATGPGRKAEAIAAEPRVSLTVTEVDSGDRWRCVVARGVCRWVDDAAGRLRALGLISRRQARLPGSLDVSPRGVRRLMDARVLVIEPSEISGRVRG